jgi:hypothetical protein
LLFSHAFAFFQRIAFLPLIVIPAKAGIQRLRFSCQSIPDKAKALDPGLRRDDEPKADRTIVATT